MRLTAEAVRQMSSSRRAALFSRMTDSEAAVLLRDWSFWGRPEQQMPASMLENSEVSTWLLLAGRGFGKTRVGAEVIAAEAESGRSGRMALIAETAADARDVMVEGESGILARAKPWFKPLYEPSKRRITWPNGAVAFTYNATEPDQLRGPQHDFAWGDELAKWRYSQETFDQLQFGLRLGKRPRSMFTTTPRPIKIVRDMLSDRTVVVTRGRTRDNATNLPRSFMTKIMDRYEGTRIGRQELDAEILDDMPGALWTRSVLERAYMPPFPDLSFPLDLFTRIVVGVDPAVSSNPWSDETGIVVVGTLLSNGHVVVIEDLSGKMTPTEWSGAAVRAYKRYRADKIVAEANQGGDMVETVMRAVDANINVRLVHATKGKFVRAEPVSALYERGLVHHLGSLPVLEDQMCQFTRDMDREKTQFSPDHVDALVWGITELKIDDSDGSAIIDFYKEQVRRDLDRKAAAERAAMTERLSALSGAQS